MSKLTVSKNNIGVAGEFYIAYLLAKHNFKVNVSLGRTEGFDLFVQNPSGVNMIISIKTTFKETSRSFIMGKKADELAEDDLFYAFVRLNGLGGIPDFWIIPSKIVAPVIKEAHKIHVETAGKNGKMHKDTNMRLLRLHDHFKFPEDWAKQLEGFKGNINLLIDFKK